MPLECPLCASRRPFLRVERFKNSDGRIGVRAYQDTGGIAAWRANGFESIPSDAGAQVVEAYTVCRNGHVALDDPGVGAHLQGTTHPVLSVLRSHGQGDDLAVGLLGQTDGGLDGVLVELVEDVLLAAHEPTVLDATLGLDVRNVLDADHDSHGLKVAITAASRH